MLGLASSDKGRAQQEKPPWLERHTANAPSSPLMQPKVRANYRLFVRVRCEQTRQHSISLVRAARQATAAKELFAVSSRRAVRRATKAPSYCVDLYPRMEFGSPPTGQRLIFPKHSTPIAGGTLRRVARPQQLTKRSWWSR